MGNPTQQSRSAFEQGAASLSKMPAEAIQSAKDLATDVRDGAAELMEAGADKVREGAANLKEAVLDETSNLEKVLTKAIRRDPIRSMFIAMGFGCAIGLMIARR